MHEFLVAAIVLVVAIIVAGLLDLAVERGIFKRWRKSKSLARARGIVLKPAAATTPHYAPPSPSQVISPSPPIVTPEKIHPRSQPAPAKHRFLDRMVAIMKVSDSLTVDQLAAALGVDVAFVWAHVFTWADHFGFKVVDGRVIFKGADIEGLITELDHHFKEWENKEKSSEEK